MLEAWERRFRVNYSKFKEAEGHCRLPQSYKLDGFNLGAWVGRQRTKQESLSSERKQRLDGIGFIWDTLIEAWEEGFSKLLQFKELEGHCRVPSSYKLEGFKLGQWVRVQRTNKDIMPPERKQRLDGIGFIWDTLIEAWEEGFSKLLQFKELEGHCRVPSSYKLEGFKLGQWVRVQRTNKDIMSPERKQRLDVLGFIWDPFSEAWEEGFSKLLQFKELEGHCQVPATSKMEGYTLGQWVHSQRNQEDMLSPERIQRLNDVGFSWDPWAEVWEEGFAKLLQFREDNGHFKVPKSYKLEGFKLGIWFQNQRTKKRQHAP